ncbi:hypothetical protein OGATHE_003745 [Ogataea polymorpha]|uniref:Uncharacterized protein n=1 Tax=Ogataea polymorpha TaxID=460523 RepID=A0A9P8P4M3_9ASCO|nr:hypothetical protein OGATHE_003745 [Ogataea polymorpha]
MNVSESSDDTSASELESMGVLDSNLGIFDLWISSELSPPASIIGLRGLLGKSAACNGVIGIFTPSEAESDMFIKFENCTN